MLPHYVGPHDVGLATFGCHSNQSASTSATLPNGEPALLHEEVVFNVFYPAKPAPNAKKGVSWTFKPFGWYLMGWTKFLGYSRWVLFPLVYYGSWIRMPVYPNANLLEPPPEVSSWPVIVYSHGLAGSRNMYSHFCANLASEGFVVIVPDHHDGTGTYCMIRDNEGKLSPKLYLRPTEVKWTSEPDSKFAFRVDQLAFRRHEIYEALAAFRNLANRGQPDPLYMIDGSTNSYDWSRWKDSVNVESKVTLAGHSFGGATILSILSNPPPEGYEEVDVRGAVLLDPWLEPFSTPGPQPTKPGTFDMTIISSEAFTVWSTHFSRVEKLFSDWRATNTKGYFFTFLRSLHFSFSDIPLCLPFFRRKTMKMMNRVHQIVLTAIRGEDMDKIIEQTRAEGKLKEMELVHERKKKFLVGQDEDIIMH